MIKVDLCNYKHCSSQCLILPKAFTYCRYNATRDTPLSSPNVVWSVEGGGRVCMFICLWNDNYFLPASAPQHLSREALYGVMRYTRDEGAKSATTRAHPALAGQCPVELHSRYFLVVGQLD